LDRAPRTALKICLNSDGRPWASENSFRSAFFKLVRNLQAEGLLDSGATFHGLRHTVGVNARGDGESDFRVAAALGDSSTVMAQVYGRDADRQAAQAEVLKGVQKRFENASLETKLETAPTKSEDSAISPCNDVEAWAGIEPACTDLQSAA
jgi:hypothetical protein